MATIVNEIDKIISSAQARINDVNLPSNVFVPSTNITAGFGRNLLSNSGFYLGTDEWIANQAWSMNLTGFSIVGSQQKTIWISSTTDVYISKLPPYGTPVIPGQTLEVSAYTGSIGASVFIYCNFYDSAGQFAGQGTVIREDRTNNQEKIGGDNLTDFKRCYQFVTVPANAATVAIVMQKSASAITSYAFVTLPFLAVAHPGQTELSNWSEGSGGQTVTITPNNYQNYLENGAISVMSSVLSAAAATTVKTVTLNVDSNGANVLIHFSVKLTSTINSTTVGSCRVYAVIKMNGTQIDYVDMGHFINPTGGTAIVATLSSTLYVASPPVGTVTYSAEFTPAFSGNGTGGNISNAKMEIIGLKR